MKKYNLLPFFFIFIISVFSVLDLFVNTGQPATFDAPIHITFIAQYTNALLSGNLPVSWLGGIGNYGLPLGLFSHQLPLTLGGLVNIILHNPVLTFNILLFLGIFLSNIFFYKFLRIYFSSLASLCAVTLLTLSSYRILDIYIRGDMPEIFSGIFLSIILIGIHTFIQKKKIRGLFFTALGYSGLSLTHPMMLAIYSFFIFPYALFVFISTYPNFWKFREALTRHILRIPIFLLVFIFLGIGVAGYFLIPLISETKYLYYGLSKNHLALLFLSWENFFHEGWPYFYQNDIFIRGNFIQLGIIEITVFILGIFLSIYEIIRKGIKGITLVSLTIFVGIVVLFFTTKLSLPIYMKIPMLTDIQFPWRMLAVFIFLPPIVLAALLDRAHKKYLFILVIFIICILRFPQLYGKNYTNYPVSSYYFTVRNLSSIDMNTIWTGKTESYPLEKNKINIIGGNGEIISEKINNTKRNYIVNAETPMRLVDYTFYFPGWNVYVDGQKTPIQFQDPNYRGVITYNVPAGKHNILVTFQDTLVRKLGKIISIIFGAVLIGAFIIRNKLREFIF